MYKLVLTLFIMLVCSLSVFAAKYKINTSGKVTTPSGQVQQGNQQNQTNLYNNYYSSQYVSSKQVTANQVGTILIIMDYSGSMANWIREAKKSMSQIIAQLPSSTKIGFRVFGHVNGLGEYHPNMGDVKSIVKAQDGKYKVNTVTSNSYLGDTSGFCAATKTISPVAANNSSSILRGMNIVLTGGATPMTFALEQGVNKDFAGMAKTYPKKIVLITDGEENCGGDPCAFARQLMKKRNDIHIDVVLVSSGSRGLKCLSDTTGGNFYYTNDLSSFSNVMLQSMQSPPSQPQSQPKPIQSQQYEFVD